MPITVPNGKGLGYINRMPGSAIAPTLQALTLSGSLQIGTATSGTIIGATSGSTIIRNIPGITVDGPNRTYSGTPTGSAGVISNALVETLAGAVGSPKSNSITVAASGGGALAFTNTVQNAGVATIAYSWTPVVTGALGTLSFSLSGSLPTGLSFSTVTGAITGTPTTVQSLTGIGITATDSGGATPATLSGQAIQVFARGTLNIVGTIAYAGEVWSTALGGHTYLSAVTLASSDGGTPTWDPGIAASQNGFMNYTFVTAGTYVVSGNEAIGGDFAMQITVLPVPSAPSASAFATSANALKTAYLARQSSISVAASPWTITNLTVRQAGLANVAVSSVPLGYSGPFGSGATWILANIAANTKTYARGATLRFRCQGRYFDFVVGTSAGMDQMRFRTQPYNGGAGGTMEWATVDPYILETPASTTYVTVDMGSYADRIIECIAGELSAYTFMGFESGFGPTSAPNSLPRMMVLGDSYHWGQGAREPVQSFGRQLAFNYGLPDCYNNGQRQNAWGRFGGSASTQPFMGDRIYGNCFGFNEVTQFGNLDFLLLSGTLNDNTADTTRLYNQAKLGFRKARAALPTTPIVFVTQLAGPDARGSAGVIAAYVNAFTDALGSDPGATMINNVTANWIPNTGVGTTIYFPSGASSTTSSVTGTVFTAGSASTLDWRVTDTLLTSPGAPNGQTIDSFGTGTGDAGTYNLNRASTRTSQTIATDTAHPVQPGHDLFATNIFTAALTFTNSLATI